MGIFNFFGWGFWLGLLRIGVYGVSGNNMLNKEIYSLFYDCFGFVSINNMFCCVYLVGGLKSMKYIY